jgi:Ser-tRNA(Ala) deacylase AlaX
MLQFASALIAVRGWAKGARLSEFSGVVTDIREESRVAGRQRWQMALDRTEFGVGDVGVLEAVARSGARLVVPVLEVVKEGDEIWHVVDKPLAAGTLVTGRVGADVE